MPVYGWVDAVYAVYAVDAVYGWVDAAAIVVVGSVSVSVLSYVIVKLRT